jgi:hypothetical protein
VDNIGQAGFRITNKPVYLIFPGKAFQLAYKASYEPSTQNNSS